MNMPIPSYDLSQKPQLLWTEEEYKQAFADRQRAMGAVVAPKSVLRFTDQVDKVAMIVKQKNQAYGNSFGTAGKALRILYPDGIKPEQYDDALLITRIWDKIKRLSVDNDPFGESPYVDIAGYAICGATMKEDK